MQSSHAAIAIRIADEALLRGILIEDTFSRETVPRIAIDINFPVRLCRAHLLTKRGPLVKGRDGVSITVENENLGADRLFCWYRSTENAVQRDQSRTPQPPMQHPTAAIRARSHSRHCWNAVSAAKSRRRNRKRSLRNGPTTFIGF